MHEKLHSKLAALAAQDGLSEDELLAVLETDGFRIGVSRVLDARSERAANGRAGVSQVVRTVEFIGRPYTDEGGKYVSYKCVVCQTPAKIRQALIRGKNQDKPQEPRQTNIPGT